MITGKEEGTVCEVCCTHTMPVPHLSQRGNFCSEDVAAWGFVTGALTLLVTMGFVPRRKTTVSNHWGYDWFPHVDSTHSSALKAQQALIFAMTAVKNAYEKSN